MEEQFVRQFSSPNAPKVRKLMSIVTGGPLNVKVNALRTESIRRGDEQGMQFLGAARSEIHVRTSG